MKEQNSKAKGYRLDFIVIGTILLISVLLLLITTLTQKEGALHQFAMRPIERSIGRY